MTRAKYAPATRKGKKKVLKAVKGQYSSRSRLIRTAKEALRRALVISYAHRKRKKGDFRSLWIERINAASRMCGLSYSEFISGLRKMKINLNRKMLADMAASDMEAFKALAAKTRKV